MSDYFLVSLSNHLNLKLCIDHAMAGFTNSINGFWTFVEIEVGDYISFLYGARVKNLYRVVRKAAYRDAENLPPWPSVTFASGRTYFFPFRLYLEQKREFDEPMVRPEFSYVAENLLLRGGYRRTHFHADSITFQYASCMGTTSKEKIDNWITVGREFVPEIVFKRDAEHPPYRLCFRELILQSLVRKRLGEMLAFIVEEFGLDVGPEELEILGEKALPEGHVDLVIKPKHPCARNPHLLVEVKRGKASAKDMDQLRRYIEEPGYEIIGGVLVASGFSSNIKTDKRVLLVKYSLDDLESSGSYRYETLLEHLRLEPL